MLYQDIKVKRGELWYWVSKTQRVTAFIICRTAVTGYISFAAGENRVIEFLPVTKSDLLMLLTDQTTDMHTASGIHVKVRRLFTRRLEARMYDRSFIGG
jgi:hypothetical protein